MSASVCCRLVWLPVALPAALITLVGALVGPLLLIPLLPLLALRHLCIPRRPPPARDPSDRRVVVTGGSSGIGKAVAAEFLARGARVTLVARGQAGLDAAVAELGGGEGAAVEALSLDVSAGSAVVGSALASVGEVDILVCAAGVSYPAVFEQSSDDEWNQLIQVNLMGCVSCINAVLPGMKRRQSGQILLVSSMAGQVGIYGLSAYSASKFALRGLAESLRMECKPFNVTVSLAFPPDTDTPMLAAENQRKALECKKISEGAGLFSAEAVAKSILSGMQTGRFFVVQGLDGLMLSHLTAGMVPSTDLIEAVVGILLGPLFRLIALAHSIPWDWMVQAEHQKKVATGALMADTA